MVQRARLQEQLRAALGAKLVVLAAPAGYGKSTLLATACELGELAGPVAWLTLDKEDDDPVVLWSYLLEALRRACPALEIPSSPESVGRTETVDAYLTELVNALSLVGDVTLVLDDFHLLSGGRGRESFGWFLDHAPANLRIIVAGRSDPPLRLSGLRAHGELVELRAIDLGFTTEEAELLLNDRLGLGLSGDDVEELVTRNEGWPAGVYLAALSLRAVDDRHAFVARFGAANRHVVDFLVDEVLDAHDPALQTLMLRCSVLKQLCGPLCDALLEQHGSAEQLSELASTNLFLIPLDDRGQWFRFHHLFGQLLRVELERREPGLAPSLHERAHMWHRDHGSTDEAIGHALDSGSFELAHDLIAARWAEYANAGRHATVLGWLDRLPPELRESSTALQALDRPARVRSRKTDDELSERERVVLRALTGPLSEGDIGRELYLSRNTVHSHVQSIYRKLGVSSRADAIRRGRELGLI